MKNLQDASGPEIFAESPSEPPPTGAGESATKTHEYQWTDTGHTHIHAKLLPALLEVLGPSARRSLIDLGCGNGSLTGAMASRGFSAVGVDVTGAGIEMARSGNPSIPFTKHDLQRPLPDHLRGNFDVALSAEVIEHMYLPRELFHRADEALKPGGLLVLTTPYHGWLKNVALAVTNKFDHHWSPGWDFGHVKFFSVKTLSAMASECDFEVDLIRRVGRIPPLAMTMIAIARRSNEASRSR